MRWALILSSICAILMIIILNVYFFIPIGKTSFINKYNHTNFTTNLSTEMQFYQNMRYADKDISYRIADCTLKKSEDMEEAFSWLEGKTMLNFVPVEENEEISITCDSKTRMDGGLFIAGEGGPTNITQLDGFNLILHGKVLLIRDSNCQTANVALHELLHALGFTHTDNPENIMYNISDCNQQLGQDIPEMIDTLYSVPSYSDLALEDAAAKIHNKYLDLNVSIRNYGFRTSEESKIEIYVNDKLKKTFDLKGLDPGFGTTIMLQNILITQLSVDQVRILVVNSGNELDKSNNEIVLE